MHLRHALIYAETHAVLLQITYSPLLNNKTLSASVSYTRALFPKQSPLNDVTEKAD